MKEILAKYSAGVIGPLDRIVLRTRSDAVRNQAPIGIGAETVVDLVGRAFANRGQVEDFAFAGCYQLNPIHGSPSNRAASRTLTEKSSAARDVMTRDVQPKSSGNARCEEREVFQG